MWKLAILGETQYLNGCIASYKLFIYLFVLFCFFFLQSFRQYTEVWSRPLSDGSVAVVLFSRRHDQPYVIEAFFDEVPLR